jgi:2,3-diaminopropionate biosynthesis protein SbnA
MLGDKSAALGAVRCYAFVGRLGVRRRAIVSTAERTTSFARPTRALREVVRMYQLNPMFLRGLTVCDSITELIGNTPLVRMRHLSSLVTGATIYGKPEYLNPGLSIKDRTAIGLIEDAERSGRLKPGGTIVESTSGNMGHALAMICAARGYRFVCVIDPKTPAANRKVCEAFGAQVVLVDQTDEDGGYQKNRIRRAQEIAASLKNCINLDQYGNHASWDAHAATGFEILAALAGEVDVVVASVSTGGHITGIARYLKRVKPSVMIVAVEPEGSVVFGGRYRPYRTNGAGLSFRPMNYDRSFIDCEARFTDDAAFAMARKIAREEGILLGASSGGVLAVTERLLRDRAIGGNIVTILPDGGLKYLDTVYA